MKSLLISLTCIQLVVASCADQQSESTRKGVNIGGDKFITLSGEVKDQEEATQLMLKSYNDFFWSFL